MTLTVILASALALTLSLWVISRHLHLSKWDHFPRYKSWQALPILGHAYTLGAKPMHSLFRMQKKFGNIFRMDFGPIPTIVIADFKEGDDVFRTEVCDSL